MWAECRHGTLAFYLTIRHIHNSQGNLSPNRYHHSTFRLQKKIMQILILFLLMMATMQLSDAGSKKKPHKHQGILKAYDGKHIPYKISLEENEKLDKGLSVIINERSGNDGRGIVIQDIHAPPDVCMDRIRDLVHYNQMVKNVKKVTPYETLVFPNGTVETKAEFSVGISLLTFTYYLNLKFDPAYFTLTWTLDYQFDSDFDDNTGHWQVVQHPTKPGWSRVLYSCEVKVFNWLPEFVINILTNTALVESTAWVKRESEKQSTKSVNELEPYLLGDLSSCFTINHEDQKAQYSVQCAEDQAKKFYKKEKHSEL